MKFAVATQAQRAAFTTALARTARAQFGDVEPWWLRAAGDFLISIAVALTREHVTEERARLAMASILVSECGGDVNEAIRALLAVEAMRGGEIAEG